MKKLTVLVAFLLFHSVKSDMLQLITKLNENLMTVERIMYEDYFSKITEGKEWAEFEQKFHQKYNSPNNLPEIEIITDKRDYYLKRFPDQLGKNKDVTELMGLGEIKQYLRKLKTVDELLQKAAKATVEKLPAGDEKTKLQTILNKFVAGKVGYFDLTKADQVVLNEKCLNSLSEDEKKQIQPILAEYGNRFNCDSKKRDSVCTMIDKAAADLSIAIENSKPFTEAVEPDAKLIAIETNLDIALQLEKEMVQTSGTPDTASCVRIVGYLEKPIKNNSKAVATLLKSINRGALNEKNKLTYDLLKQRFADVIQQSRQLLDRITKFVDTTTATAKAEWEDNKRRCNKPSYYEKAGTSVGSVTLNDYQTISEKIDKDLTISAAVGEEIKSCILFAATANSSTLDQKTCNNLKNALLNELSQAEAILYPR